MTGTVAQTSSDHLPKGSLILVAGPSGVGKDTLIDGARAALDGLRAYAFARRVITRDPEAGGEDYHPVTEPEFEQMRLRGAFLHHWDAHGLRYGIPVVVRRWLEEGTHVIVNVSRAVIPQIRAVWPDTLTLLIDASPEVVAARLRARGREAPDQIARRLARAATVPDGSGAVIRILNDRSPAEGVRAFVEAVMGAAAPRFCARPARVDLGARALCLLSDIHPATAGLTAASGRVEILAPNGARAVAELGVLRAPLGQSEPAEVAALSPALMERLMLAPGDPLVLAAAPSPESRAILQRKVAGGTLSDAEIDAVVGDMVAGRYSEAELAGFLVAASRDLAAPEVIALTRARAARAARQSWPGEIVVDKHSMGGIPGNRITPIIIPIVTALGLTMPKTSSRAITSAAGTADAMEVIARVDLTPDELHACVTETGGCIAWNGRLTHSPVDQVMNAINRPLGLRSTRLDVSSILSKKLAAGSTHVLIDMPVGPEAKTRDAADAQDLADLFTTVAEGVGLSLKVMQTDGTGPVGRGVGPVLEMRDVFAVLEGRPDAPTDLRDKALRYAAEILHWAAGMGAAEAADAARACLDEGRALEQLHRIAAAQGLLAETPPPPAPYTAEITATGAGRLIGFGVRAVSGTARAAGAPREPTAGVDLLVGPGATLAPGTPLLRIHAATRFALASAEAVARAALADGSLMRRDDSAPAPSCAG